MKRYLVKLSGEVLKGSQDSGISFEMVDGFCKRLSAVIRSGKAQLAFVIGGGNIFRGVSGELNGFDRLYGDNIGMMATVMNCLAVAERLRFYGVEVLLQSGIKIEGVVNLFNYDEANDVLNRGGAVIFCGGTGNPYFSTDTTASLRALQIKADCLFKATKVDGVYDKDPMKYPDAVKYESINYDEVIAKGLEIMDLTAMLMLKKNKMPLKVFCMNDSDSLEKAVAGENVGTTVNY
ncbi:MAG: UMP kinase [Spirochaetales bacterium]|nr:UMP kinase [Spirochaetales bacterium]